jgi:hypothetical protein
VKSRSGHGQDTVKSRSGHGQVSVSSRSSHGQGSQKALLPLVQKMKAVGSSTMVSGLGYVGLV